MGVTISRVLQSISIAHTRRFHRRHGSSGHVWQGRFKSPVVQDDGHLWTVLRYIEANPLRARMVADPSDYRWSSYPAHGDGRPDPLLTPLPEWSHRGRDEAHRRAEWRRRVLADPDDAELTAIRQSLCTGYPFGDPAWANPLADRLGLPAADAPRPVGRPRKLDQTGLLPQAAAVPASSGKNSGRR